MRSKKNDALQSIQFSLSKVNNWSYLQIRLHLKINFDKQR